MPQTTVEKNFFRIRASKKSSGNEATIFPSFTVIEFQGFPENITGDEE
ncbi:MAG: hypothetical protein ACRC80_31690 [Waterburya sp.]